MAFKHLILGLFAFAASLALSPAYAKTVKVVGFGDSLMAGYGLGPGEGFPEKLQAALQDKGHDVVISNAGVSGDTTSGGLSRLDWSVPDDTDLVILELGANDMLRGISPETAEKNLDSMLQRLKGRGIDVLLAGMFAAPNLGADYGDRFNAIYPTLAKKYDVTLYPFFLDGVAGERSYALEDGMHPNAKGIDRMVERFLPTMEAELAKQRDGS
ncbi:arylesterase [Corticibacterium sp. UT-5YL-CI-8]|nr:arylesterase [Tianweitania sp. UT-5YL-CI-8]